MSENTIVDGEIINVSEEELPAVISEQFRAIVEIDKKIEAAERACAAAKEAADNIILHKGLNGKEAIGSTQNAVRSLADAQAALTEAQRLLFENQAKMADGMRYLLMLGASSIATTRTVILELEGKMKQAAGEELSERAKAELMDVIRLLRDQESAFSRQERIAGAVKANSSAIDEIHSVDAQQDETDRRHDAKDQEHDAKDKEHDELLLQIKRIAFAALGVAGIALVVAIVALFL